MKKKRMILTILVCILAAVSWYYEEFLYQPEPMSGLDVYFIDVGQGDAALLVCDGYTMLIDGGDNSAENTVADFLTGHGITYLDYIVSTHPHADHCGGLDAAAQVADIGTVWSPCLTYDTRSFRDFADTCAEKGVGITIPEVDTPYALGDATVTVLYPRDQNVPENVNDWSIVLRVDYGETSFLFTGDAEQSAETIFLEAGCDVHCDVLKVGHHGSSTSTGYRLLYEADPAYAVISCGAGNDYGHPHRETVSALNDAGVTILRTDTMGTVTFHSDGVTLTYETEF